MSPAATKSNNGFCRVLMAASHPFNAKPTSCERCHFEVEAAPAALTD